MTLTTPRIPSPSVNKTTIDERPQTLGEEIANSISHGVGLAGALVAFPLLVIAASQRGDITGIVSVSVFATTMVLLYLASTLFHALPPGRAKRVFQVLDHSAIFLLIAGTYTPFTLGALRGAWGWTLFAVIWTLAVLGVIAKNTVGFRYPRISVLMYVGMGWAAIVAIRPLAAALDDAALRWLLAGGACYTLGVPFYVWKSRRYTHAAWHAFVLAGVACHFVAVLGVLRDVT